MFDFKYKVKRSKSIILFTWVLCAFVELMFGAVAVLLIVRLATGDYKTYNDPISQLCADIITISFSFIVILLLLSVCIYLSVETKKQVDVYTMDKMYRKKGDKIIFEIEYNQIDTIKEGFFAFTYTFCIFCKEPIIKKNGKKGAKTLIEYYSRKDREKVKQIIASYFELNKIAY